LEPLGIVTALITLPPEVSEKLVPLPAGVAPRFTTVAASASAGIPALSANWIPIEVVAIEEAVIVDPVKRIST
jgi:hypothetical protein